MGGKRNLVLGRCAALLFLCGAAASLPTNAILGADAGAYWVNLLALLSAITCLVIPWHRIDRRWLHVLVVVATAEVVVAVIIHARHAIVFMWYFVLVAVFAAYAFRRRAEAALHIASCALGMVVTAAYAHALEPDAIANAIVGIPTVCVAAGVVVWLRENLERRERTDPLTGLANRRALMEELEQALGDRSERTLVLFDLDGFKRYNDRLGHAAGDALLEVLGAQLTAAVAGRGEAFRLGGDELCVLLKDPAALPDCDAALRGDGISASHGEAWLPHEADTPSGALSLADSRMYAAKRAATEVPFVLSTETKTGSPLPSLSAPSAPAPRPAR
jgi:GGDEF domain-containing protein